MDIFDMLFSKAKQDKALAMLLSILLSPPVIIIALIVLAVGGIGALFLGNNVETKNTTTDNGYSYSYNSTSDNAQYDVPTVSGADSSQSVQNQGATANTGEGATYVLTTNADKQAPWAETTRFEVGVSNNGSVIVTGSQQGVTNPYNSITVPSTNTPVPSVNTQAALSTTWPTISSSQNANNNGQSNDTSSTSKITTTEPSTTEETTTQKADPVAVDVIVTSTYVDSDGIFHVEIDSSGWGGTLYSKTQYIPVTVDGVQLEKSVKIRIVSDKTPDGNQSIELDLRDYGVDLSSATVSFVVPEGFLTTVSGSKYNNAFEVTN